MASKSNRVKNKGGRPSKFDKAKIDQAQKLCELGATDEEIAAFFKIDVRTFYRWKNENPKFCHAIKVGKAVADDRVERSLYQRAVGYEQQEVKIFMPASAEAPVYAPFTAKVAPDVTAQIFWLKNRRKETWRDRQEVGHDVTDDLAAVLERARKRARSSQEA